MAVPKVVGPYEIVELLGRGGMGEVYKAIDTRMYNRPVALKLISEALGADPRALSRFDFEIETAANLRHPNIVQIYDRGEYEGRRYFAMEFLDGKDLTSVIQERAARALDARVEIILQLCDALDYAHTREKPVVHRDIKPANVLVTTRGGTDHVKLLDFGIAHVDRSDHTKTVVQPGTTLYMSPEQLNDAPVTPQSDLFSVGIVAFELFAGVHPFKGRTDYLTSANIMYTRQPSLRSLEAAAPEALELLVDALLEKDAGSRIGSAAEVAGELRKLVRHLRSGPTDLDPPSLGNLDEMTSVMVERIVHFAKSRERTGALVEAREAYKRALLLAPGAPWLEAQVMRIDAAMNASPQSEVEPVDSTAGLHTSARDRHRESFVSERLVEAGAVLDDGDLDKASSIVAGVLRRYPDDSRALALMDRIVLITDRGLDVKPYRQAIRAAREALANGDLPAALRSCAAAVAIWPDDDEVISLDREIEGVRKVEMATALAVCDAVLGRAAGGAVPDGGLQSELARARDALRRAEEMGAAAPLVEEKTGALLRIEREAKHRADERQKQEREAEKARLAEIARLMDEARGALVAAEGAAEAKSWQASLAGVRAALPSAARAESLGADRGETQDLAGRLESAARELEKRIALDAEQERIAKRLQDEKARQEKDRLARERRRSLLDEASAGYREADDLAVSIDTEADRMGTPLAAARRAVDEMLKIEAGDEEAKALRKRIERLEKLAAEHAASAAQLREDAKRRERVALRHTLVRGAIAAAVAVVLAGGWYGFSQWSGGRERARLAEIADRTARDRAQAATTFSYAGAELARLRSGMARINTEPQRSQALSECDALIEKINGAAGLDPANGDAARLVTTASNLRTELRDVRIKETPPPPPPVGAVVDDAALNATLKSIREELRFAGNVPRGPLSEVDRGLQRADHGIDLAKGILAADPGHAETKTLLSKLQATRSTLVRWQQDLRADDAKKGERQESDLAAAATLLEKAEAALKSKREPAAALADSDQVARTLGIILRDDPHQRDALALRTRNDRVREELTKLRDATPPEIPTPDKKTETPNVQPATALDMNAVQSLFSAYKSALIARDPGAIRKVYPGYPSIAQLGKLQQFEYDFLIVRVDGEKNQVVIRQTTRERYPPGYWDKAQTATLQYALSRNPEGSWYIQSGRIAPK